MEAMNSEAIFLDAGACPHCGAEVTVIKGNVTLRHPPDSCCLARSLWAISWLQFKQNEAWAAQEISRIRKKARELLSSEADPQAALTSAMAEAKQHVNAGNVYSAGAILHSMLKAR